MDLPGLFDDVALDLVDIADFFALNKPLIHLDEIFVGIPESLQSLEQLVSLSSRSHSINIILQGLIVFVFPIGQTLLELVLLHRILHHIYGHFGQDEHKIVPFDLAVVVGSWHLLLQGVQELLSYLFRIAD